MPSYIVFKNISKLGCFTLLLQVENYVNGFCYSTLCQSISNHVLLLKGNVNYSSSVLFNVVFNVHGVCQMLSFSLFNSKINLKEKMMVLDKQINVTKVTQNTSK